MTLHKIVTVTNSSQGYEALLFAKSMCCTRNSLAAPRICLHLKKKQIARERTALRSRVASKLLNQARMLLVRLHRSISTPDKRIRKGGFMRSKLQTLFSLLFLSVLLLILPSVAYAGTCGAIGVNLVANCGFETGDLTGWTFIPAGSGSDFHIFGSNSHTGNYDAGFGAVSGQNDYIYQDLATTVGHTYDINFWVDASQGVAGQFVANWGATNLLTITGDVVGGYIDYNFLMTATSSTTRLEFGGNTPPSFYLLDDVVVTDQGVAAAEPSSSLLLSINLLAAAVIGMGWKLSKSGASSTRQASVA